jgi:SAM-dependent methyltransferase
VSATPDGALDNRLGRLLDFAEPTSEDVCLDLAYGGEPAAEAMSSRAGSVTVADVAPRPAPRDDLSAPAVRADSRALPYRDGAFSLIMVRFSLLRLPDPVRSLREMLRVCRPGGELIIADLIRRACTAVDRDRLERLRDPGHPAIPTLDGLTELLADAGAEVRRLEVFTVESPAEPWLAGANDARATVQLRQALTAEVDGGPRTGARPRMIGGELWFTRTLAHIAAVPAPPGSADRQGAAARTGLAGRLRAPEAPPPAGPARTPPAGSRRPGPPPR